MCVCVETGFFSAPLLTVKCITTILKCFSSACKMYTVTKWAPFLGGKGLWAVYFTSPQSFIILVRWPNNFGTVIEFCLVGSLCWVSKCFNHWLYSSEGVILCIINGDVHRFVGQCLIPSDPGYFFCTSASSSWQNYFWFQFNFINVLYNYIYFEYTNIIWPKAHFFTLVISWKIT